MCRATAWDAIVLGGNKQGGIICEQLCESHLSGVHYLGAVFRVAFIWGDYQYSVILWGNSLNSPCPRAYYLRGNCLGAFVRGAMVQAAIVLEPLTNIKPRK